VRIAAVLSYQARVGMIGWHFDLRCVGGRGIDEAPGLAFVGAAPQAEAFGVDGARVVGVEDEEAYAAAA